ncbi:catalase family peroxidase [soil metagenome]
MPVPLADDVLAKLDIASGGIHPGFRPVHAKGVMVAGTFTPSTAAVDLTRAPHASNPTPVTARFSLAPGIPTVADNAATGVGPQGMAVRFHLDEHVHTDIISHSHNGFPARNGEEFLAFLDAAIASGPGSVVPPPIIAFLASHPAAKAYVEAPKPLSASYAQQAYFAVTAFKFTSVVGSSRFGRFRIQPQAGTSFLTPEEAAAKSANFLADELKTRIASGPLLFQVSVQLAESGDVVDNSTVIWPETRTQVEFGTISLTTLVDADAPEIRKIIFDLVPRVDGIDTAGDPLTDLRSDIYLLSGRRRRTAKT